MALISGCLSVIAATVVAFLPMRGQFPPGLALLIAAPVLLAWVAWDHGLWLFAAGLFAFLSMFRRPLAYFTRCAFSLETERAS